MKPFFLATVGALQACGDASWAAASAAFQYLWYIYIILFVRHGAHITAAHPFRFAKTWPVSIGRHSTSFGLPVCDRLHKSHASISARNMRPGCGVTQE